LATAPAAITLHFNEEPLDGMVDVAITDAAGAMVATSTAAVQGVEVTIPWPGTIGAGDYTVAYRVVSADGHPITGTFTFTYTGTPTNPDEEVVVDTAVGQEIVTEVAQSDSGSSTPLIIGIAVVVVLALGGLIAWRRTRR
jgi:LPXTG-motif cell wall-anchored protein